MIVARKWNRIYTYGLPNGPRAALLPGGKKPAPLLDFAKVQLPTPDNKGVHRALPT